MAKQVAEGDHTEMTESSEGPGKKKKKKFKSKEPARWQDVNLELDKRVSYNNLLVHSISMFQKEKQILRDWPRKSLQQWMTTVSEK